MAPFRPSPTRIGAPDAPDYRRRDLRCRDIVDHAIGFQASRNTMAAVEYLKSHDIAAHIIERVLLDPLQRRGNAAPSTPP